MDAKTLLTIEQFDQLPREKEFLYELSEGEAVISPAPALRHDLVRQNVFDCLTNFVEARSLGWATIRLGYQLSADTVRIPDVSFLPAERLRGLDPESRVKAAPALAIEIVSNADRAQDIRQRVDQYLAAGAHAVWVFYPKIRVVDVSHASRSGSFAREGEKLEEPELFPGFSLELKLVFE